MNKVEKPSPPKGFKFTKDNIIESGRFYSEWVWEALGEASALQSCYGINLNGEDLCGERYLPWEVVGILADGESKFGFDFYVWAETPFEETNKPTPLKNKNNMKMTLEQFTKWIEETRQYHKKVDELYKLGLDVLELVCANPDTYLFDFVFDKAQREYIFWWLYDCPNGINEEGFKRESSKVTWDENGEEASIYLDSIEALYNYISGLEDSADE